MSTCRRRTIQLSKNAKYRKRRFSPDLVATATADIGRQRADAEFDAHIFRCGNLRNRRKYEPQTQPQKQQATTGSSGVASRHRLLPVLFGLPGIWAENRWESSRRVNPLASNPIRKPFSYHPPVYASTPRVPVLQLAIFKPTMATEGMQEEFLEMFSLYVSQVPVVTLDFGKGLLHVLSFTTDCASRSRVRIFFQASPGWHEHRNEDPDHLPHSVTDDGLAESTLSRSYPFPVRR
jgi:hypothetical protein